MSYNEFPEFDKSVADMSKYFEKDHKNVKVSARTFGWWWNDMVGDFTETPVLLFIDFPEGYVTVECRPDGPADYGAYKPKDIDVDFDDEVYGNIESTLRSKANDIALEYCDELNYIIDEFKGWFDEEE